MKKIFNLLIENEVKTILESFRGFSFSKFNNLQNSFEKYLYAKKHLPLLGVGSSRTVFGIGAGKVLKLAGNYSYIKTRENSNWVDPELVKTNYSNFKKLSTANFNSVFGNTRKSITRGISQNMEEVGVFTNPKTKPIVTKIYNFDNNFMWIVSEAIRETNKEEFGMYAKMSFGMFQGFLYTRNSSYIEDAEFYITELSKKLSYPNLSTLERKKLSDLNKFSGKNLKTQKEIFNYLVSFVNGEFFKGVTALVDSGILIGDVVNIKHWGKASDGRIAILDYGYTENNIHLYVY